MKWKKARRKTKREEEEQKESEEGVKAKGRCGLRLSHKVNRSSPQPPPAGY